MDELLKEIEDVIRKSTQDTCANEPNQEEKIALTPQENSNTLYSQDSYDTSNNPESSPAEDDSNGNDNNTENAAAVDDYTIIGGNSEFIDVVNSDTITEDNSESIKPKVKIRQRVRHFFRIPDEPRIQPKTYKKAFIELITDWRFFVPLILIILIGFLFEITHTSISIDDLSRDRYINGELFAQGRMTSTIIRQILQITIFAPVVEHILSLLLFAGGATLFCTLFKISSNDSIKFVCYPIFACSLVSYPLLAEIYVYLGTTINIGFCFFSVALSLIYVQKFLDSPKIRYLIGSSVLICFIISAYESFATVYLLGILIVLILQLIYNKEHHKGLFFNIKKFCVYLIPLALGVVIEGTVTNLIMKIFKIKASHNGANGIAYFAKTSKSFLEIVSSVFKGIYQNYILNAEIYLPILILDICLVACVVLLIFYAIKHKSATLALLFTGTILCLISLSLIQGVVSPYRTCQVFYLFVAFIGLLSVQTILYYVKVKGIQVAAVAIAAIAIFYQGNFLNKIFYGDYLRSEEEQVIINEIAYELDSNFDTTKPIIFVGINRTSDNVKTFFYKDGKKITQTVGSSYITWGVKSFGEVNTELLKYFKLCGHTYKQGTEKQYVQAVKLQKSMASWPKQGSVLDNGDYIIVNLGN